MEEAHDFCQNSMYNTITDDHHDNHHQLVYLADYFPQLVAWSTFFLAECHSQIVTMMNACVIYYPAQVLPDKTPRALQGVPNIHPERVVWYKENTIQVV